MNLSKIYMSSFLSADLYLIITCLSSKARSFDFCCKARKVKNIDKMLILP